MVAARTASTLRGSRLLSRRARPRWHAGLALWRGAFARACRPGYAGGPSGAAYSPRGRRWGISSRPRTSPARWHAINPENIFGSATISASHVFLLKIDPAGRELLPPGGRLAHSILDHREDDLDNQNGQPYIGIGHFHVCLSIPGALVAAGAVLTRGASPRPDCLGGSNLAPERPGIPNLLSEALPGAPGLRAVLTEAFRPVLFALPPARYAQVPARGGGPLFAEERCRSELSSFCSCPACAGGAV